MGRYVPQTVAINNNNNGNNNQAILASAGLDSGPVKNAKREDIIMQKRSPECPSTKEAQVVLPVQIPKNRSSRSACFALIRSLAISRSIPFEQ